jgi:hypothetical protein
MGSSGSKGAKPAAKAGTAAAADAAKAAVSNAKQIYVGVDLGGTNAKAGVVDASGKLLKRADIPLTDKVYDCSPVPPFFNLKDCPVSSFRSLSVREWTFH